MITLVAYYEKSKPLIFFFQTKLTKNIHILVENNKKSYFFRLKTKSLNLKVTKLVFTNDHE